MENVIVFESRKCSHIISGGLWRSLFFFEIVACKFNHENKIKAQ